MVGWDSEDFLKNVKIEPFRGLMDKINEPSKSCRVTYLPTGESVTVEQYRDLHKNKIRALQALFLKVN